MDGSGYAWAGASGQEDSAILRELEALERALRSYAGLFRSDASGEEVLAAGSAAMTRLRRVARLLLCEQIRRDMEGLAAGTDAPCRVVDRHVDLLDAIR